MSKEIFEVKYMRIGARVLFNNTIYKILYIYPTGYCELKKEDDPFKFELIHIKDLEKIKDTRNN